MFALCSYTCTSKNEKRQRQKQQQKEVMRDILKNKRQHENVGSTLALKKKLSSEEDGSEIE